jgi:membrane fusion protein (multidrug efflux system)
MFRHESASVGEELSRPLDSTAPKTKSKKRIWILAGASLFAIVALLVGIKAAQIVTMIKAGKSFVPPPEAVTTAKAEAGNWPAVRPAIGSLIAVRAVTLSSEVTGTVREILFESGASVTKGTVVVRLDISTEQAQLESARADAALAKINFARARKLRETGANTQSELDTAAARAKQADATVAGLEATIAKKTIRAPFDGRAAIRQVELGQVLSPGSPIVSFQSVTPMYAEFSLPQQSLAHLKVDQKVRLRTDIFPDSSWSGKITVINPEVDLVTRNVRVRATLDNRDGRLSPGAFVNIEVLSDESRPVIAIPATGILYAPYGDSVYVVEESKAPDGKTTLIARQKFIRLGERRGDFVAVVSGLSPGETVVSTGAFKVRNGMPVMVNNTLAPPASLDPKPAEQ